MPSSPLYVHCLDEGIATLEATAGDLVDRRTLEEALGVSKWTAWRLLKRCGAEDGPGNTLVCRRADLLRSLRTLQQDGRHAPEIARRRRVDAYLTEIAQYASQKHREIARDDQATVLANSRLASLPPGIDLSRGELRIQFDGSADFLQKFGAMLFALKNDFDAVAHFLDEGS